MTMVVIAIVVVMMVVVVVMVLMVIMMVVVVVIHVSHRCVDVFSAVVQLVDYFYTGAALLIFLTMTMTFSIMTIVAYSC